MTTHKGKTDRNPSSFDLATLSAQQRKLHDEIAASWNDACRQHASLGRRLVEMHRTFVRSGEVKRGGPGSQWTRYLSAVGIPKSTANDYMEFANRREKAGIGKRTEKYLASAGVPLDKPRVNDALLTSELRKQVGAINSAKDAERLKPVIMEMARKPKTRSAVDKQVSEGDLAAIDKGKAIVAAVRYFDRFDGKVFRIKFADFWRELRQGLWDKLSPVGAKKPPATATEPVKTEAAV